MKFSNLIAFSLLTCITLFSCSSDNEPPFDPAAQLQIDKQIIKEFVAKQYPNAIEDASGIWYEMLNTAETATFTYRFNQDGSEIFPSTTTNYKLTLLNGTQVDANQKPEGFTAPLRGLVQAWHIAFFPKAVGNQKHIGLTNRGLQPGDEIRIITPSLYAYGRRNTPGLPANSPLIFEIKVLKIEN